MRTVIQRVLKASVEVEGEIVGSIAGGLLVYLGVGTEDTEKDCEYIADKLVSLRIFADENGKMNHSLIDMGGDILLVSQFTLYGNCHKGRRPGFDAAAGPEMANKYYELTANLLRGKNIQVAMGVFGAHMRITSVNDGPVTFILNSR